MSRLIDADKLEPSEVYMDYGFTRIVYMDDIDEMPTVDAAEVVRCKDCKHSEHWYGDKHLCHLWNEIGIDVFGDGYCSYGERKEE